MSETRVASLHRCCDVAYEDGTEGLVEVYRRICSHMDHKWEAQHYSSQRIDSISPNAIKELSTPSDVAIWWALLQSTSNIEREHARCSDMDLAFSAINVSYRDFSRRSLEGSQWKFRSDPAADAPYQSLLAA